MQDRKILVIDIETCPALAYVWGLWDQNISLSQLLKPSRPICFAAKYVGKPEVFFHSDWTDGHDGMIKAAHKLLSEADAVVGYNSDAFDLKKLNGEFLLAGLTPPPPLTSIDLLKTIKKMGLQSGKLAYVGPVLGLGGKVKHQGFNLWADVMDGKESAQKKMMKYNIGDIRLTEKLYNRIKSYILNHPFLGTDRQECGTCGKGPLQKRGHRRTKSYLIQRLQCQNCGSWLDGTRKKID